MGESVMRAFAAVGKNESPLLADSCRWRVKAASEGDDRAGSEGAWLTLLTCVGGTHGELSLIHCFSVRAFANRLERNGYQRVLPRS